MRCSLSEILISYTCVYLVFFTSKNPGDPTTKMNLSHGICLGYIAIYRNFIFHNDLSSQIKRAYHVTFDKAHYYCQKYMPYAKELYAFVDTLTSVDENVFTVVKIETLTNTDPTKKPTNVTIDTLTPHILHTICTQTSTPDSNVSSIPFNCAIDVVVSNATPTPTHNMDDLLHNKYY